MTLANLPWLRKIGTGIIIGLIICSFVPAGRTANLQADTSPVAIWWPSNDAHVTGVQPFKAVIDGYDISNYRMTWSVDNGTENLMGNSWQDSAHKEALVDLSSWNWGSGGRYTITFRAYNQSGTLIGETTSALYTTTASATSPAVPTVTLSQSSIASVSTTVTQFYASPGGSALTSAAAFATIRPGDAQILQRLGTTPTAQWFGGWNTNVTGDVDALVSSAAAAHKTPLLVTYNIPNRDCGSYSGGGASASGYSSWIHALTAGLKGRPAIVIVEPDALAQVNCLASGDQAARYAMLAGAVATLETDTNAKVYLDAGHPGWVDPAVMASRLKAAGIYQAEGFSLNVSNFISTQNNSVYGHAISQLIGGKHFVIDTSRNGAGGTADGQWCNPGGQALGLSPTTATNDATIDAFLWLKTPGESDGACNGGPSAGTWWPDYALTLAKNAGY
jgi:endoglucanase